MKKIFFLFIALICISKAHTQNVGIGTISPNSLALLDVYSTTRGFLPPRMDSAQRNAIVSPPAGLTIYNTTSKGFECYNGTKWYGTVHFIGEDYGGGIVYYVYDNGQHGLIAAIADAKGGADVLWGNSNSLTYAYGGRTIGGTGIGAGKSNTDIIIAAPGSAFANGYVYAARVCREYSVTVGGVTYEDWYLPSLEELNLLYLQRALVGGFATGYNYWSSCEGNTVDNVFNQNFTSGAQGLTTKSFTSKVRAVRSF